MYYLSDLSGNLSADNFNSTAIPGVCKAVDAATLEIVKGFQRQLNRVAKVKNFPMISPDGEIGGKTLALFVLVQNAAAALESTSIEGDASSCITLAANVDDISGYVENYANALDAPLTVSSPAPASTPSFVPKGTNNPQSQGIGASIGDAFKNMSTIEKLALVGTVGAIGFVVYETTKRRSKKRRR